MSHTMRNPVPFLRTETRPQPAAAPELVPSLTRAPATGPTSRNGG